MIQSQLQETISKAKIGVDINSAVLIVYQNRLQKGGQIVHLDIPVYNASIRIGMTVDNVFFLY